MQALNINHWRNFTKKGSREEHLLEENVNSRDFFKKIIDIVTCCSMIETMEQKEKIDDAGAREINYWFLLVD